MISEFYAAEVGGRLDISAPGTSDHQTSIGAIVAQVRPCSKKGIYTFVRLHTSKEQHDTAAALTIFARLSYPVKSPSIQISRFLVIGAGTELPESMEQR